MKKVAKIMTILLVLCIATCIFVACDKDEGGSSSPAGKTYKLDKVEVNDEYDLSDWQESLPILKLTSNLFNDVTDIDSFKVAYNKYLTNDMKAKYSVTMSFDKDGTCVFSMKSLSDPTDSEEYTLNWEKDGSGYKIISDELVDEEEGIYFEIKGNTVIYHGTGDGDIDLYLKA